MLINILLTKQMECGISSMQVQLILFPADYYVFPLRSQLTKTCFPYSSMPETRDKKWNAVCQKRPVC